MQVAFTNTHLFQPTLPARGATAQLATELGNVESISTHAPRTGSDDKEWFFNLCCTISTHAPRTGSDVSNSASICLILFQPTLPARGATVKGEALCSNLRNFNPRSPHGERLKEGFSLFNHQVFQPTLPARGATLLPDAPAVADGISTHAPRTGSDICASRHPADGSDFNPRSPHGERPFSLYNDGLYTVFQPTLPARGATRDYSMKVSAQIFQPTLPARGATRLVWHDTIVDINFNPRSPHGERLSQKL